MFLNTAHGRVTFDLEQSRTVSESPRLLIVDDDRSFAHELAADAEGLGLSVETVHDRINVRSVSMSCKPSIIRHGSCYVRWQSKLRERAT